MSFLRAIKYQLYLLQLENYELDRFFRLLFKKGLWPKGQQRKNLVWTTKASAVFILAVVLHLLLPVVLYAVLSRGFLNAGIIYQTLSILLFIVLFFCYFILYVLALILLWPFDVLAKAIIVFQAKSRIKILDRLKIIGIAGSYGKTTMKEILSTVLSVKFKVVATPESVNTPLGIARWVLEKFSGDLEIALVEMGEHYPGDIAYLCGITPPDVAVITGINESHLERMKSMAAVIGTVFEIVSRAKPGALVLVNGDDKNVAQNYKKFVWPDHRLEKYQVSSIKYQNFNAKKLCWEAEVADIEKVEINLLGEYALADVQATVIIAKSLGMNSEEIKKGLLNIEPIKHRLQPVKTTGDILVIDDSYNGNPDGVREAVRVLSRFKDRRKVYITPGLVEMGGESAEIHRKIGRLLANAADVVILIRDSVTPFVEEGIKDQGLRINSKIPQVFWFNTAQEAHASLGKILKPNDVVLFQNDWGDQYL